MLHALCRYPAANSSVSKVNGQLPGGPVAAERVVDAAEPAAQIERTRIHVCVFACEFDRCQASVRAGVNASRCPRVHSNGGADVRMVPYGALHAAVAVNDAVRATIGSSPRCPAGAGAVWRAVPKFWHLYMLYSVGPGYVMLFRHPILSIVTLM